MEDRRRVASKRRGRLRAKEQSAIAVIGTGYVGLVAGTCFAEMGHRVIGVDISAERMASLAQGKVPYFEPGLDSLLAKVLSRGQIGFTTDLELAVRNATTLFITVGTPSTSGGASDTSAIFSIAREIAVAADSPRTVVIKSTAPPGTAAAVQAAVDQVQPGMITVLVNPEFLREGSAIQDFTEPTRIVIGAREPREAAPLLSIYRPLPADAPRLVVNRESAELGKYTANAFLATRVSFINEISDLCTAAGANVHDVRDIAGLDPRVGTTYMEPGLGYGGSCLPKDLRAIEAMAQRHQVELRLLPQVSNVNRERPRRLASIIADRLGGVRGKRIAVWGLSFKPNTDDVRESPALELVRHLVDGDARVSVFDPQAMHAGASALNIGVGYGTDPFGAVERAEALVVATDWPEFKHTDWHRVSTLLERPLVFDGRGSLDREHLASFGLEVIGFDANVSPDESALTRVEAIKEVA